METWLRILHGDAAGIPRKSRAGHPGVGEPRSTYRSRLIPAGVDHRARKMALSRGRAAAGKGECWRSPRLDDRYGALPAPCEQLVSDLELMSQARLFAHQTRNRILVA